MKTHIVIDLETLDTKQSAKITAIGVYIFNEAYPADDRKDLMLLAHSQQYGRTVSQPTVEFWNKQDAALRSAMLESGTRTLRDALSHLSNVVMSHPEALVWGNGPTFDISILEHAYDTCAMPYPWDFWSIRDMRTMLMAAEVVTGKYAKEEVKRPERLVMHNALFDAEYEAMLLKWALRALRSKGEV